MTLKGYGVQGSGKADTHVVRSVVMRKINDSTFVLIVYRRLKMFNMKILGKIIFKTYQPFAGYFNPVNIFRL